MARLVWQTGAAGNVAFDLGQTPLLVGRGDECDIRVDEPLVSRTHARIDWRSGVHVVVDLQSTNFTRVNGRRVLVEQALEPGDLVQFARAVCVYEV